MKVLYDEGLANHIGPEPCGGLREGTDEKLVEARLGGVSRRESGSSRVPTPVGEWKAIEFGSIWVPGSYMSRISSKAPNNAFPRRLTLCTNSKKPK